MQAIQATNAASSGVKIPTKALKDLNQRKDGPGLRCLALWLALLGGFGALIWASLGTPWLILALLPYSVILAVPAYALSHETAHRTAFKTKWLDETVFYITSWLYGEEPIHRRYSHINHHEATWHAGIDSQMPFDTPMSFWDWFREASSIGLWHFHVQVAIRLLLRRPSATMRAVIPPQHLPAAQRNQALFIAGYILALVPIAFGQYATLWFLIIPRILGGPVMLMFTMLQHAELQENDPDIRKSTRSFRGSWWASFLYMNMENHVEHHLYSSIPFHALPHLSSTLGDQVPDKDPGFIPSSLDILSVVWRRSRGLPTKARLVRQAPHMVTDGGPLVRMAQRSM